MLNTNSCSAALPYRIETGYFMKLYQNGERKLITGVNHHSLPSAWAEAFQVRSL
ncbi:hypothetical protein HMPREF9406_0642 [Clostridium sp. HGF2]|nr:hypothetical protein HMPREF9406_0642 [Clostridium sp. HGF2]EQJ58592.1 hypothetical protein QSI_1874 [Clostridioides difficile P28]